MSTQRRKLLSALSFPLAGGRLKTPGWGLGQWEARPFPLCQGPDQSGTGLPVAIHLCSLQVHHAWAPFQSSLRASGLTRFAELGVDQLLPSVCPRVITQPLCALVLSPAERSRSSTHWNSCCWVKYLPDSPQTRQALSSLLLTQKPWLSTLCPLYRGGAKERSD